MSNRMGILRRQQILECLADFPDGATVHEVCADFDDMCTREFMRGQLRMLIQQGLVVKGERIAEGVTRGRRRRVTYRLASQAVVPLAGERASGVAGDGGGASS